MSGEPGLIVAVDGGGSGCRVRLTDFRGRELAAASGGPANIRTDFEAARANIMAAVRSAYAAIGADPARMCRDVALLGLAGAGHPDLARRMERALGFGRLRVVDDRETTVQGALGTADGTVALVGTGSFFVRRRNGQERRIGGWGLRLGDECGGAWLGRELLRAVARAEDGLIGHSPLTRSVLRRLEQETTGGLVGFATAASPGDLARLAPELVAAARADDPVAAEIMTRAVGLFCERLDALGTAGDLHVLGGLAEAYVARLPERHRRRCRAPRGTALDGAVALALALALRPAAAADDRT